MYRKYTVSPSFYGLLAKTRHLSHNKNNKSVIQFIISENSCSGCCCTSGVQKHHRREADRDPGPRWWGALLCLLPWWPSARNLLQRQESQGGHIKRTVSRVTLFIISPLHTACVCVTPRCGMWSEPSCWGCSKRSTKNKSTTVSLPTRHTVPCWPPAQMTRS